MDAIDEKIIDLLKSNARMQLSEISRHIHLTVPAVSERIRKLEQQRIIESYTVRLNQKKVGRPLMAFIFVTLDSPRAIPEFTEKVLQSTHVLACHHLAGEYDYLLKVASSGTEELETFLSSYLKKISGIRRTNTLIALSCIKEAG
ncbi:Lrp/AsnC family transcriptional regulator [Sporolactobacillus spathodeae]|uniref:Lrp/AsnC family leucine-responsive transcriptional regulator n=1 Tax=Sporolactobacillus spathodeae TaxID=1465502 RepID=A0ABS2QBZ0_9BACL|nr:Lrp/AsnC family transcriptional regulator [Sporolactobacillus spathodeae]MBM7658482.1 Lrp/AsnC family leucine-responsive transcriptional regulator [Sporolactobacillus spathodeae]